MSERDLLIMLSGGPVAHEAAGLLPPVDADELAVEALVEVSFVRVNGAEVEPISADGREKWGDIVYRASKEFSQVYVLDDGSVVRLFDAVGQWDCDGRWEGGGE